MDDPVAVQEATREIQNSDFLKLAQINVAVQAPDVAGAELLGGSMAQQSSIEIPAQNLRDAGQAPDRTGKPDEPCRTVAQPQVGLAPEGHIFLILPPEEVVTGTMAATAAMEVERLAGARKLPMLLVLSGVEALTRGARTVFSNAHSLQAVAVLGVSPVDRVIANFLLGGAVQPCPTRYFSTEPEALAWLKRKATVA